MASEMPPDPFEEVSGSPPTVSSNQPKSWTQIRQVVKKTRRLATSIISRVPHSFTFRHITGENGAITTRLYFLGVPQGSRENTLLYVDLPADTLSSDETLTWQPLLEAFHATPVHGQFSKEEQLLRERKRLGSFGITSYDYFSEKGKFVFPACNSLFVCNDALAEGQLVAQAAFPAEVKSSSKSTRLDPKICPNDPNLLAFISGNDIWVTNLVTGTERRLTHSHKGDCSLSEDPLSAGVPSFVVQEEFDRYTGYWWQPALAEKDKTGVFRILYEEVDESEVEILQIASANGDTKGDEYRYPRAGTPNAKSRLKMVEFTLGDFEDIVNVVDKQLSMPLEILFPEMEYIPRIGWLPDGQSIYAAVLDRPQLTQQLLAIPLDMFVPWVSDDIEMAAPDTACPIHILYEDKSDVWINVHDILHFLPCDLPSHVRFLWSSEKSGFRHLYLVTVRLAQIPQSTEQDGQMQDDSLQDTQCNTSNGLQGQVVHEVALTSGDWEVSAKQIWVNEDKKLVFFMGLKDTPMESHLYVVSYENPGSVIRLTEPGVSHAVEMDEMCSMFVTVYSRIDTPPAGSVYMLAFTEDGQIIPQKLGALLQPTTSTEEYNAPELFNYQSEAGNTMYGMIFKPTELEPGQKCPTVLVVYGGPQVQMVTNAYKGHRFLRLHTLTALGYAVVVVDSRGSAHRGLQFESHIKHRLGTVEIADQVEGLQWVASQVDFIDLSRVAIHGWSYGGYLSLMGLAQRPDVFKVAIAGAPVTSWTLYDTGYTERYMDTPHRNFDSYTQGSVLEYIERLPSEGNRLLIVHGLIDENVHFFHTSLLINALIKYCKPYQLQVYPNERHGIRNPDASEHYETMVLNFLQQNL